MGQSGQAIVVRTVNGGVELSGIGLADAQDIFRGLAVFEAYGVVFVPATASKARTALREIGGYRTKAAS